MPLSLGPPLAKVYLASLSRPPLSPSCPSPTSSPLATTSPLPTSRRIRRPPAHVPAPKDRGPVPSSSSTTSPTPPRKNRRRAAATPPTLFPYSTTGCRPSRPRFWSPEPIKTLPAPPSLIFPSCPSSRVLSRAPHAAPDLHRSPVSSGCRAAPSPPPSAPPLRTAHRPPLYPSDPPLSHHIHHEAEPRASSTASSRSPPPREVSPGHATATHSIAAPCRTSVKRKGLCDASMTPRHLNSAHQVQLNSSFSRPKKLTKSFRPPYSTKTGSAPTIRPPIPKTRFIKTAKQRSDAPLTTDLLHPLYTAKLVSPKATTLTEREWKTLSNSGIPAIIDDSK